jgi:hypothetical protein
MTPEQVETAALEMTKRLLGEAGQRSTTGQQQTEKFAVNTSTGERIVSRDGGVTWEPVQ